MAEKKANFRFLGYKITDAQIHIEPDKKVSKQFNVNFERTIGVNEDERRMKLDFKATINDTNEALNIDVAAEGIFEFEKGLPDDMKDVFFRTNAPAILFPYVRAYITTLSALSGVDPVILPTLNLSDR